MLQDAHTRRIVSKVNGRKIVFDNIELKKTLNPKQSEKLNDTLTYFNEDEEFAHGGDHEANDHDSSRLSTEFYEEYYRLINSIKKEQRNLQKGNNSKHSRMGDVSS